MKKQKTERDFLRHDFEAACNAYLKEFCRKHEYDYEDAKKCWVAEDTGGITMIGDLFVNLTDIRTDIDRDAPVDEFLKWYDHTKTLRFLSTDNYQLPQINYKAWLRGAPRLTDESLAYLEKRAEEVREAEERTREARARFEDVLRTTKY